MIVLRDAVWNALTTQFFNMEHQLRYLSATNKNTSANNYAPELIITLRISVHPVYISAEQALRAICDDVT